MKKIIPLTLMLLAGFVQAQGFIPKTSTSTSAGAESARPLLIGETVPESLVVLGENGNQRPLLSYKAPTEMLVVVFFSLPCDTAQAQWQAFRRLEERYREWRVAFVAVTASSPEILSATLKKEHIPWPVLSDTQKTVATALKITGTPELLILDEFGQLRYRGPAAPVRKALDTFIAQISPVQDPEPPLGPACAY